MKKNYWGVYRPPPPWIGADEQRGSPWGILPDASAWIGAEMNQVETNCTISLWRDYHRHRQVALVGAGPHSAGYRSQARRISRVTGLALAARGNRD